MFFEMVFVYFNDSFKHPTDRYRIVEEDTFLSK